MLARHGLLMVRLRPAKHLHGHGAVPVLLLADDERDAGTRSGRPAFSWAFIERPSKARSAANPADRSDVGEVAGATSRTGEVHDERRRARRRRARPSRARRHAGLVAGEQDPLDPRAEAHARRRRAAERLGESVVAPAAADRVLRCSSARGELEGRPRVVVEAADEEVVDARSRCRARRGRRGRRRSAPGRARRARRRDAGRPRALPGTPAACSRAPAAGSSAKRPVCSSHSSSSWSARYADEPLAVRRQAVAVAHRVHPQLDRARARPRYRSRRAARSPRRRGRGRRSRAPRRRAGGAGGSGRPGAARSGTPASAYHAFHGTCGRCWTKARTTEAVPSGRSARCRPPLSSNSYISFVTTSDSSPDAAPEDPDVLEHRG